MNKQNKHFNSPAAICIVALFVLGFVPVQAQSLTELIERASSFGIDQSQISTLQSRGMEMGLSEEDVMNLILPAVAMAEKNLPHDMIFDKAFEGISKRVPVDQLQPILNSILESSSQSAQFIDRWVERPEVGNMLQKPDAGIGQAEFRNEMIKATSKGLMQNFDRGVMEETLNAVADGGIMERTRPSGIITAISVLSDLPSGAQEPAESARLVLRALEGGFNASDLQKLPGAMGMAQRRSQLPAQAVAEGLTRQLQGGFPASEILQNLFNGELGGGPPGNTPPGLNQQRPGNRQN